MLLFTSETFQQNELQESLDTIQRSLYERPPDVAPHAPAIQADVRALGDRLLDQDQQQKRFDLIRSCVNFLMQSPTKDEVTKEPLQHLEKGTDVDERTAELYSKQGIADVTELMVIDETTQCEVCEGHNTKGKYLCTCGSILQE